jgi:hypothetical protein
VCQPRGRWDGEDSERQNYVGGVLVKRPWFLRLGVALLLVLGLVACVPAVAPTVAPP